MNDEYIKKTDITQRVLAITGEWKDGPEFWIPIDPVLGNIALLHAEDVAPVRHGHWEVIDAEEPRRYGCSECKRLSWYMENYCPNCGAKMDEGE
jgi:hypothetical protein